VIAGQYQILQNFLKYKNFVETGNFWKFHSLWKTACTRWWPVNVKWCCLCTVYAIGGGACCGDWVAAGVVLRVSGHPAARPRPSAELHTDLSTDDPQLCR